MPSLAHHHSGSLTKILCIGDSKTGKTSSLISLVKAGYKLRILDFDNLLDPLANLVAAECPDLADNVDYRALRDERKATANGMVISGIPNAYVDGIRMLDKWAYGEGDDGVDLGRPAEWGHDCVLVIDSLSRLCDAAYDWRDALTPKSGKGGTQFDGRAIYGDAQDTVESVLAGLTAPSFATNVIVIAHLAYMDMPDGRKRGFPQGVGKALSPKIPQYFPNVVWYTRKGTDRIIQTSSQPLIDLSPPPKAEESYPNLTGLAQIFRLSSIQRKDQPQAPSAPAPLRRPQTVTTIRR